MNRLRFVTTVSLPMLVVLAASPALAQGGRPGRSAPTEQDNMRLQIAAMEGVLATAVHEIHGAQLEKVAPGLLQFDGAIRARGFHLDGYGVFFDVDLPPLPRAAVWTFRVLDTPVRLDFELAQLRRQMASISDARLRQEIEQTIRTIQRKVTVSASGSFGVRPGDQASGGDAARGDGEMVQARTVPPGGMAPPAVPPPPAARPNEDPFAAYASELGQALADLMVQWGGTITLGPNDWLTVSARENQPRLLPGGPAQMALTLRVKGSDLAAFKAGRLGLEDARKRVEIREF
jgi:hypothetical protein